MRPLTSSPYYHKTKGMFTEVWLSHWLSVVANTVLRCLHPVKRAYFASVPEEQAASISRASTCKVEMANLPPKCQQHNPLLHGIRRERHTHTHTHTHRYTKHAHRWVWDLHTCQIGHTHACMHARTPTRPHMHTAEFEACTLARYGIVDECTMILCGCSYKLDLL